ncbi:glycerophosphodiester phosphodiesterase family protein [Falsihalocynthiibacter sp. SS001]|uniref:glycerophosphodiester phosphodiesterase family protein n=1 Tax=Falsihalocynthiibacter sp. SS001 TaxID=3349698 RepID=UPI0036D30474
MERIRKVLTSFQVARQHWWALFGTHLTFQILVAAIVAPLIGIVLALVIRASNQSAITDQDIAAFVLSPFGLVGTLLVSSLIITALIIDFAVMTVIIESKERSAISAIRKGIGFIVPQLWPLFLFCLGLIIRIVVISAPFLLLSAWIALRNITEFDINYYLTYWPPEFIRSAVLIAAILLIGAIVLLSFLSGWGVALHYVMLEKLSTLEALKQSRERLKGQRWGLVKDVIIWVLVRFVLTTLVVLLFTKLTAIVLDLAQVNLRLTALILMAVFAVWGIVYVAVTSVINGALAHLLYERFVKVSGRGWKNTGITEEEASLPLWGVISGAVAVLVAGAFFASFLFEKVERNTDVEIIAHRGAAGLRPENTMASVNQALDDGTDWVEIDVQESAEGELIIAHDSDFMKLANDPLKTWEATRPDLDRIDIGSWFSEEYADERTPLLKDVLEAAKGRSKVVIELKYYGHDVNLEQKVIDLVEEYEMADQVALMSLKYPAVQKLRSMRPEWRLGVLAATAVGDVTGLDADFLALNAGQISRRLVRQAHAQNKDVYAWTVNDPVQMSSLISMGVDGLITDEPARARQVLELRAGLSTSELLVLWVADFIELAPKNLVAKAEDA